MIPFVTVLGMLYGKRSVYIFEHAEQLINLPPLPFSFDIDIYNRVVPALKRTLMSKRLLLSKNITLVLLIIFEQEKQLFTSFIELLAIIW